MALGQIRLSKGLERRALPTCSANLLYGSNYCRQESAQAVKDILKSGPITLDSERFEVIVGSEPVPVTATEFRILKTLMQGQGRVLDRTQLIDSVLGTAVAVTDRTIDVHIAGLRKKLGEHAAAWVQTIRGVGYTFRDPS